jgi:hypothetical protein
LYEKQPMYAASYVRDGAMAGKIYFSSHFVIAIAHNSCLAAIATVLKSVRKDWLE